MPTKKKATTKKEPKLTKKKVAQKSVSRKTAVKKTVAKKSTRKKAPQNKVTGTKKVAQNSRAKKTSTATAKVTKAKNLNNEELTLPTNASLRSKAKVRAIEMNLDEYIHMSVFKTAYVSAVCFILVGSLLTLSTLVPENLQYSQKSEIIGALSGTSSPIELASLPAPVEQVQESFSFNFLTTLPEVLESRAKVRFSVTGINEARVYLVPQGGKMNAQLDVEQLSDTVYELYLDPETIDEGTYEIRVMNMLINRNIVFQTDGPFIVRQPIVEEIAREEDVSTEPLVPEESNEPVEQDVIDESDSAEDDIATDKEDDAIIEPIINQDTVPDFGGNDPVSTGVVGSTEKEAVKEVADVLVEEATDFVEETKEIQESEQVQEPNLQLARPVLNERNNTFRATLEAGGDFKFVELYARRTNSLNEMFIGLATRYGDGWRFEFSANNLPNGFYQFKAKSRLGGKEYVSNGVIINIDRPKLLERVTDSSINTNVLDSEQDTPETRLRELGERNTAPAVADESISGNSLLQEPIQREFEELDDEDFESEESKLQFTRENLIKRDTRDVLKENSLELNNLLRNYASAVQTGDQTTIELAKTELDSKRENIIREGLRDSDTRENIDDIARQLEEEINAIKKKVEDFEVLRRQKTEVDISSDRDGDGISDFDEENIYKTNPDSADTDNDGFNDNIEILRGFDPLDSEPEVPVEFQSPRETVGLIRDDVLKVEAVNPVVTNSDRMNSVLPPVRAEIRGRSLPNSFVTLFIFSSPTVVTVRTDSDGSFAYTFDKELEDGSHEIYVAVTDNTGSIIAQSNPFSFIKEAEAFSPVSESVDAVPVTPVNPMAVSTNNYTIVIGMSVISFGVILLLLGMGIRTKKEDEIIEAHSSKGWPKVDINNKTNVA